jgi:hypothetical protein
MLDVLQKVGAYSSREVAEQAVTVEVEVNRFSITVLELSKLSVYTLMISSPF